MKKTKATTMRDEHDDHEQTVRFLMLWAWVVLASILAFLLVLVSTAPAGARPLGVYYSHVPAHWFLDKGPRVLDVTGQNSETWTGPPNGEVISKDHDERPLYVGRAVAGQRACRPVLYGGVAEPALGCHH